MDVTQIIVSGVTALVSIGASYGIIRERLNNVKENLKSHEENTRKAMIDLKVEITETMGGCRLNSADKADTLLDYIKRVEASKADKSEVNLVIDTMRRVEQKLDLLIMRDNK